MQSYIICDYIWLLEMERKNQRSHQKNLKGPSQLNLHPWAKVFRVVEIHRGWVSSWSSLMKPVASQTSAMCGDGERTSGQQKMWGWHMISKQNHGSVHKKMNIERINTWYLDCLTLKGEQNPLVCGLRV